MTPRPTRRQRLNAKRKRMPRDLADLHWYLEEELVWLHLGWKEYKTLCATNQARVDLLNSTAPNFFAHYEDTVWRETLMHLCRLTDPPKTGGKNNLTVMRLADAIPLRGLKSRVKKKASSAHSAAKFARDWRNRRIAHRSLEHAFKPSSRPLALVSRSRVEKALGALRDTLNAVALHYEGYVHDFEGVVAAFEGAQSLLYYLSSGLEAAEARRKAGILWSPKHW